MNAIAYALASLIPKTVQTGSDRFVKSSAVYVLGDSYGTPKSSVLPNGQIVVTGGTSAGQASSRYTYQYDPYAQTFTRKADNTLFFMQTHAQCTLNDGTIFVTGGDNVGNNPKDSAIYSPTMNTWTRKADMPSPKADHEMVTLDSGLAFLAGGHMYSQYVPGHSSAGNVYTYDPASNTYTAKATGSPGYEFQGMAKLADGKVAHCGGIPCGNNSAQNYNYIYNPTANTWTIKTAMPMGRARSGMVTTATGTVLWPAGYIFDGYNIVQTNSMVEYDPTADSWLKHPISLPEQIYAAYAQKLPNSAEIVVICGLPSAAQSLTALHYVPLTTSVTPGRTALLAYLASL